jgi:hypothetical protein
MTKHAHMIDPKQEQQVDPVMPASANRSAHAPTSGKGLTPGQRRHTGENGAPGNPGNAPASPLETTPTTYDDGDGDQR